MFCFQRGDRRVQQTYPNLQLLVDYRRKISCPALTRLKVLSETSSLTHEKNPHELNTVQNVRNKLYYSSLTTAEADSSLIPVKLGPRSLRLTNTREASWDLELYWKQRWLAKMDREETNQFQRTGGNGFSSLVQSVFHSALVMEISLVPARDQRLLMQFIWRGRDIRSVERTFEWRKFVFWPCLNSAFVSDFSLIWLSLLNI